MTKKDNLHITDTNQAIELILADDTQDHLDFMFKQKTNTAAHNIEIILHQHDAASILQQHYAPPTTVAPEATSTEANILFELGIETNTTRK